MRVARVLLPSHSGFDLKCFRIDRAAGAGSSDVSWTLAGRGAAALGSTPERQLTRELRELAPAVLHVYGFGPVPHTLIAAAGGPWLSDRALQVSRPLLGRRPRERAKALFEEIPEPVADEYFAAIPPFTSSARPIVGTLRRGSRIASSCELVDARIRRFRDDVDWRLFDAPPPAESMASVDLWLDPATDEDDLDGLVCEAIALGLPVVASRTSANRRRTDDGRAAALCPKSDPNEMAHAIVTMLFKPERTARFRAASSEIRERFRSARRLEALLAAYAEVVQ